MTAALPFLTTAGKVVSAVSTVAGAFSSRDEEYAAADASEYNRANAQQNAMLARRGAESEAYLVRRSGERILSSQQAAVAASGTTQGGSAADIRADTMAMIETDALTTLYNGELRALGFDRTAALDGLAAENARRTGDARFASGLLGAVPSAISAGKSIWNLFNSGSSGSSSSSTSASDLIFNPL